MQKILVFGSSDKEESAINCAPLIPLTVNTKYTTRLQSVDHILNGETKSPSENKIKFETTSSTNTKKGESMMETLIQNRWLSISSHLLLVMFKVTNYFCYFIDRIEANPTLHPYNIDKLCLWGVLEIRPGRAIWAGFIPIFQLLVSEDLKWFQSSATQVTRNQ